MLGLLFYAAPTFFLAYLFPRVWNNGAFGLGFRMVLGFALLTIALFALHVIIGLGLRTTAFSVLGLSAAGAIVAAGTTWRKRREINAVATLSHPGVVLVLLGAGAIVVHGGIDYLPTTNDEFTNWLGSARILHFFGGVVPAMKHMVLADYPPGWRLLLAAPWQFDGSVAPGLSAAAPFVLHVATLALMFDVVVSIASARLNLTPGRIQLLAWASLLLFAAAEGLGRLWPLYLLIEPPQIYTYAAIILTLMMAEMTPNRRQRLFVAIGLLFGAAYLIKEAALTLIVGVAPAAFLMVVLDGGDAKWRRAVSAVAALTLPVAIIVLAWSTFKVGGGCVASPLSILRVDFVSGRDYAGITWRIFAAIGSYAIHYKTAVFAAAAVGAAAGWVLLRARLTLISLAAFAIVYFAAVVAFHWVCFTSSLDWTDLVSIPRYSRVVVQTFHGLGLVMLTLGAVELAATRLKKPLSIALCSRAGLATALAAVVLLGAWQGRQVYRSVVDVGDRSLFSVDQRLLEIKAAADFIARAAGGRLKPKPRLIIVNQGGDGTPAIYADYFALRQAPGGVGIDRTFETVADTSWAPSRKDPFTAAKGAHEMATLLRSADIIWPMRVDDWIMDILANLGVDKGCLATLRTKVLLVNGDRTGRPNFVCIEKPSPYNGKR